MSKIIELSGQRFGHLVVQRQNGRDQWKQVRWLCKCDCGATSTVSGGSLRGGQTRSCGCRVGNHRGSTPPYNQGGDNPNAKLTVGDKTLIWALLADGMPRRVVAEKFEVSVSTISRLGC